MAKRNIKRILKQEGIVIHDVHGISMNPLLYDGDKVEIKKCHEYKIFDVVLFQRNKNSFVLHRIIGIDKNSYFIIGDNSFYIDKKNKKDILGKMIGYYRDDKHYSIEDKEYNEYLNTFIYHKQATRDLLLSNPKEFFYQRQKKAYYELIKLCLIGECDTKPFTILSSHEVNKLVDYLKYKKAIHLLGLLIIKYKINFGEEINKRAISQYNLEIFNYDRSERVVDSLSSLFNKYQIKHAYLKGAELRNRYQTPFLRVSRDIDVLIKKEDYNKAKELTIKELNAHYWCKTEHDESFNLEDSKTHVELHHTMSSRLLDDVSYLLDDPFEYGDSDNKYQYRIHFNDDVNLIYILSHSAIHLKLGQFWSSFLLDIYLLSKDNNVNVALLKEARLDKYYFTIRSILDHILFDKELDDDCKEFERFLFNSSEDISLSIEVSKTTRSKYILKRLWVPYKDLSIRYPRLQKYPVLLPLYQLRRWMRFITNRSKQIKATKEIKQDNVNKLFSSVGLEEYLDKRVF